MSRQGEIELTWTNDEGEEITHQFPGINEVCHRCEGYGSHLTPSIGNHAYSMEEFNESFDEDEAQQYFTRGGMYDVTCEVCNGDRVVQEINEKLLSPEDKILYDQYQKYKENVDRYDAEDRATYRMESGGWD